MATQDARLSRTNQYSSFTQMINGAEEEIRETSHFKIATYLIKYVGVILTKQVNNLYDKNFKSLEKEIERDTRKEMISHAHG